MDDAGYVTCRVLASANDEVSVEAIGDDQDWEATLRQRPPVSEPSGSAVAKAHNHSESLPRIVNRMLMSKSAPQPTSRNTPRGGRMMAKMNLQMSLRGEPS